MFRKFWSWVWSFFSKEQPTVYERIADSVKDKLPDIPDIPWIGTTAHIIESEITFNHPKGTTYTHTQVDNRNFRFIGYEPGGTIVYYNPRSPVVTGLNNWEVIKKEPHRKEFILNDN